MDVRSIEPRTALWALAEISWEDADGVPRRASATIEDTSRSGACVRVKLPFTVGSRVAIKWSREQFGAVAKNCRSDGRDFLIGVLRDADQSCAQRLLAGLNVPQPKIQVKSKNPANQPNKDAVSKPEQDQKGSRKLRRLAPESIDTSAATPMSAAANVLPRAPEPAPLPPRPRFQSQDSSPSCERKSMQPKGFLSKLWRTEPGGVDAPGKPILTEAPVNKTNAPASAPAAHSDLLSYEDIYHAAGVMSPRSGYSIHKVVDMLNSERLRELSKEAKRASVLMALDAAGTSADDLLHDALRRQEALNSYEAGQRKQLEEFEAQKARENAQIEAEMERIKAHYAERIQHNNDQVAKEKETLHNWQAAMQCETQRILEVIDLCGKQTAPAAATASPASGVAGAASAPEKTLAARAHVVS
ncbi:MAG TPA: hypothetical protein VKQ11_21600 [Candidatus Sulfotelmatobacter sp.]|nr:hypothetical protein [Candidatus Sulfotelmatobacter sp.]